MLKRLVPSIKKHIARLTWPNGRGIVQRDGVFYFLNLQPENWYDKQILRRGAAEPQQRAFFCKNIRCRDCDIFLDIGANAGTVMLFLLGFIVGVICTLAGLFLDIVSDHTNLANTPSDGE